MSLQISNSVSQPKDQSQKSETVGLTTNYEHCKTQSLISAHSLQSATNKSASEVSAPLNRSHNVTQSSAILSERTLNLKSQITRLDDEII